MDKEFQMIDSILKAVIGTLIISIIMWILGKIVMRFVLPIELKTRLDKFETKFDDFVETYKNNAGKNKESQISMFTMQDIQFDAMKGTNGAIRELAKSVCNGNKPDAIRLLDESDRDINSGKEIHRKATIRG